MRSIILFIIISALFSGIELCAQSNEEASSDSARAEVLKKFYRPLGFSFGIIYNRMSGVGNRLKYIKETDSYDATRLSGKMLLGFSFGLQVWKQRTQLQLELGWSNGQYLEEGGFRSTSNGGSVDTYIDIGYFVGGFRLKQALITRRLLATGGVFIVEEGRSRHAKTKSNGSFVESNSFPADEFNLWSLGLDIQLSPGLYLGYSYYWTYNQDDFDPLVGNFDDPRIEVDGFTINSFQLTLVY
ncbi:MAG: hypothetical protein ACRBF0_09380 [Calditrichia bacterium]